MANVIKKENQTSTTDHTAAVRTYCISDDLKDMLDENTARNRRRKKKHFNITNTVSSV